jgi:hypothetical protein
VASPEGAVVKKIPKWAWILGGAVAGGILLFAGEAKAARKPAWLPRGTTDENLFDGALRRLGNFIGAARIDARTYKITGDSGMVLGVQPGAKFVGEDAAALPRSVDGIDVVIKGWPR